MLVAGHRIHIKKKKKTVPRARVSTYRVPLRHERAVPLGSAVQQAPLEVRRFLKPGVLIPKTLLRRLFRDNSDMRSWYNQPNARKL